MPRHVAAERGEIAPNNVCVCVCPERGNCVRVAGGEVDVHHKAAALVRGAAGPGDDDGPTQRVAIAGGGDGVVLGGTLRRKACDHPNPRRFFGAHISNAA